MIESPKHQVGIVTFGTDGASSHPRPAVNCSLRPRPPQPRADWRVIDHLAETDNDLFEDEEPDCYANIVVRPLSLSLSSLASRLTVRRLTLTHARVARQMDRPVCPTDLDGIRHIMDMKNGGRKGDCLDAVIVATDSVFKATNVGPKTKPGKKRVIVITNAKVPCDMSEETCTMVQRGLEQGGISLEFIGIGWEEDENECFETPMQRKLDEMCAQSGGGCQPVKQVSDARLVSMKITAGNSKYRGDFEISPDVKIPCWVLGRVVEDKFPSLKKVSLVTEQDPEDEAEGKGRKYGNTAMERQYKSLTEEDHILRPEAMVKGYKYGRDRVPFSKVDEAVLKYEADKCLQLICFVKREQIPRHVFTEGVDWIVPPGKAGDDPAEKEKRAAVALNALAHAMFEEERIAIVRFVKRNKGAPSLCAIYPVRVDSDVKDDRFAQGDDDDDDEDEDGAKKVPDAPYHLYLTYLPFAEDHRDVIFPPVPDKMQPNKEELNVMDRLIDTMHLDRACEQLDESNGQVEGVDADPAWEGCLDAELKSIECWLDPSMSGLPNPVLQRFYAAVQQRALDAVDEPPSALAPGGYLLEGGKCEHLSEPQGLLCKARPDANKAMDQLRMFPRQFNHDLARKRNFSTVDTASDHNASGLNTLIDDTATKKLKGSDGSDGLVGAGIGLTQRDAATTQIGMSNPIADFEKVWQNTPEEAFRQMAGVINQMVSQSVRGHLYGKAIKCLRQLRKACKSDEDWEPLNGYLRELKGKHGVTGKPNHDFWGEIVEAGVTLINDDECEDADSTAQQAHEFIAGGAPRQAAAAAPRPVAAAVDEDDLFDELD